MICVDELISHLYGMGGTWINWGLPMYVALDRKPDNGCEIRNSECGISGIMMRLKLVRNEENEDSHLKIGEDGLHHGTRVMKYLVSPWSGTNRIMCVDSYFSSVIGAE